MRRGQRQQHDAPDFAPTVVYLTPAEVAVVTRSITGFGGHQGLLLRLVPRVTPAGRLDLTADDIVRVRAYAESYGNGGYQDRFRAIMAALARAADARGNR